MNGRKSKLSRRGSKAFRKGKKSFSKKRTKSKYVKKVRKGKAGKVKAKNVKGLSRAVHKILDGNFQHAKRIILDCKQETISANFWSVCGQAGADSNPVAELHSHMYTCGHLNEIMDHHAVMFASKTQLTDLTVTTGNFPITEKLHTLSITNHYNFCNQGQLPIFLEFYTATAKVDCSAHPYDEYIKALKANPYQWNGNYNGGDSMYNMESEFSLAPLVAKFWKFDKKSVSINPSQSFGHVVSSPIRDVIPSNHLIQSTSTGMSAYPKGSMIVFWRYMRKLVAGAEGQPRRPANGSGYGLVVDFKKVVKARRPEDVQVTTGATFPANSTLTNLAAQGNRLIVYNLYGTTTGVGNYVEPNGTQIPSPL